MSVIETILYSFATAFVFVELLNIRNWHILLNRKPFTCIPCLSGWIALFLYGWQPMAILVMMATMTFSAIMYKILNRL